MSDVAHMLRDFFDAVVEGILGVLLLVSYYGGF